MRADELCMGCMEPHGGAAVCASCGWREGVAPDSPLHLATRTVLLDQYLVGRVLGHGGFGVTYLAWDLNLETKLAVKEYLPGGVATRTSGQTTVAAYSGQAKQDFEWGLEKYLEEARVLARFKQHPGIASVINFFRANGTAYLVMEYLEGVTLAHYLEQSGGRIAWEQTLRLMLPVMDALREVHRVGILHRDISPDNVYLLQSGGVKVLDFGAARYALGQQSRNLSVILKEGYAPEEQYRTKGNQGPWTDVYATAATMYRALTGQAPTPALDRLNEDDLAPPSALGIRIPADSEAMLLKGLAVRAADRYQSMEDFQQALKSSGKTRKLTRPLAHIPEDVKPAPQPVPPRPVLSPSFADQLRLFWQRTPKQYTVGGAVLLLLLLIWAIKPDGAPSDHTAVVTPPKGGTPPRSDEPAPPPAPAVKREDPPPAPAPKREDPPPRERPVPQPSYTPPRESAALDIRSFTVEPAQARPGERVMVKWSVRGARELVIQPGIGAVTPGDNQAPVQARSTQTFTLYAEGPNGTSAQRTATLTVTGTKLEPRIVSFTATPQRIRPGEQVTLAWDVADARVVDLYPQFGSVQPVGQRVIAPVRSTEYTLMARPESGPSQSQTVRVEVATGTAARSESEAVPGARPGAAAPADAGATATAAVIHDHQGLAGVASTIGIVRNRNDYCQGRLMLRGNRVVFQGQHSFDQPVSAIAEVKTNRLPIHGKQAFHIKFKNGENYNFGAVSNDAGEIASTLENFRRTMSQ